MEKLRVVRSNWGLDFIFSGFSFDELFRVRNRAQVTARKRKRNINQEEGGASLLASRKIRVRVYRTPP